MPLNLFNNSQNPFLQWIISRDISHVVRQKTGGSDIGHITLIDGQEYIVKTGVTLSLLAQATTKLSKGEKEKSRKLLGYIVGNYINLAPATTDEEKESLTEQLETALNAVLETTQGKGLLDKAATEKLNIDDVYLLYRGIVAQNDQMKDVIGAAVFADVVGGGISQFLNNRYQVTQPGWRPSNIANHRLVFNDDGHLFQASQFLQASRPFHTFLLESFNQPQSSEQTFEQWVESCTQQFALKISQANLKGFLAGTLLRVMLGEKTDANPDNMVLTSLNDGVAVTNIDLTGFRYQRKDPGEACGLGWLAMLTETDDDQLLDLILDPTVSQERYLGELKLDKPQRAQVATAIKQVFKQQWISQVREEISHLIQWFAKQDVQVLSGHMEDVIQTAYQNLHEEMKFAPSLLQHFINVVQSTVSECITQTQEAQNAMQQDMTPSCL